MQRHNASMQIIPDGEQRCRMIWITDVLPHDIVPSIEQQMELGAAVMQRTLADPGR